MSLPAILGGPPIRPQGPPPWPPLDDAIRAALERAFADRSWGQYHGPNVPQLEERLQAYHDIPHVLLCGSGSFAIELALRAVPLRPGDEVILAGYDFPGNFLSIHAAGGMPVLVDIDAANWNMSVEAVRETLTPKTRAILVSHLHGGMAPMAELMALTRERDIVVIEDACQCPGAMIDGKKAGTWGDVGVLSFGGSKLLSAGRGGALLTSRDDLFQRARTQQLRGNLLCPLSELQAAVLMPQLEMLDERNRLRQRRAEQLIERLHDLPGLTPLRNSSERSEPGFYKLGLQYDADAFGLSRALLVAAMRAEGIALAEGFHAAHVGRSPRRYRRGSKLTEVERAHEGCLVLHHPVLLEEEPALGEVAAAIRRIHDHTQELAKRADLHPAAGHSWTD
jgi:dTDP-4-amino-4,6-dideoxygalactose transaminase